MKDYHGLGVVDTASVVMTVLMVMLPSGGKEVAGSGVVGDPDICIMKLPIPIQKAMARPASRPTTAP